MPDWGDSSCTHTCAVASVDSNYYHRLVLETKNSCSYTQIVSLMHRIHTVDDSEYQIPDTQVNYGSITFLWHCDKNYMLRPGNISTKLKIHPAAPQGREVHWSDEFKTNITAPVSTTGSFTCVSQFGFTSQKKQKLMWMNCWFACKLFGRHLKLNTSLNLYKRVQHHQCSFRIDCPTVSLHPELKHL